MREPRTREETGRRRKMSGGVIGKRLGVNEAVLDFSRYAYRWINDSAARIWAKTKQDDWDIVTNSGVKDDSADLGDAVKQVVGRNQDGSPSYAYLCRKLKTYFDDDQKDKLADLDQQLDELRRGNDRDGNSQSDYVAQSGHRL